MSIAPRTLRAVSCLAFGFAITCSITADAADALHALPGPTEEVNVTAQRVESPAYLVPAAVGVVDQQQIQLGTQELGLDESLSSVPGVFMLNRYNFTQDLRIAIRGFGARANFGIRGIRIYSDGIPLTLPDGQSGVDDIDLGSAARIEVIRGPASSLYGTAAGGVINVFTEDGPPIPFVEGTLAGGSYGYRRYQLKAGGDTGNTNYLVNASSTELDGYRDFSRVQNNILNSKLRFDFDAVSDLTAIVNVVNSPYAQDPGALTAAEVDADRRQARALNVQFDAGEELTQQKIGAVYRRDMGHGHEFSIRNYYLWREFGNKLPFEDGGQVELDRFFYGGGGQYNYTGPLAGYDNRFIIGVDADAQRDERQRFDNLDGVQGPLVFDQDEDVTSVGVYAQDEFGMTENLTLTLGVRYDEVKFEIDDAFLADGDDSGSLTFDEVSPMIALLWSRTPALSVYGNIATSFETPTTTEFANPSGGGGFNPDLEPQTATNYELGVKGVLPGRSRFGYELAVFHIKVEDELVPFELAAFPGRDFFRNAARSTRDGVELALSAEPMAGLRLSMAYTYSDFRFDTFRTDDGDVFDGNRIPGIPKQFANFEAFYQIPSGFYGRWDILAVDEFFADDANQTTVPGYAVANLRLGYMVESQGWEVSPFVGINNMFDKEYNSNIRINAFGNRYYEPAPERNAYLGITVRKTL